MLKGCRVHTTLPVSDLARARAFYEDTLGIPPTVEWPLGSSTTAASAPGSSCHRPQAGRQAPTPR